MPLSFHRVLIANRGEVAVRIARACDALGITPVFAVSEADRDAPYTRGRESVCVGGGRSAESYLDMQRVVQAAKQTRCSALHPGWGFLSENPTFAALCEAHGVTFVGPPAHVMHLMGKKTPAKRAMRAAGLTLIPGSEGVLGSLDEARRVADEVGFPVLIKAESGGGGRGMRIARGPEELEEAFTGAQREAAVAFADDRVYLERLLEGGRHVEIQIMADRYGNVCHLGERDCTVQRKHQKLIEESPSPALSSEERARTTELARRAAAAIGYVGAGTMEFLLDETGTLRFMEMNTRLQVEHPVTEMVLGVDLVKAQILTASQEFALWDRAELRPRGHAIECRLYAEDPYNRGLPSTGTLGALVWPEGPGRRFEVGFASGDRVTPYYDPMIAKAIVWDESRPRAIKKMLKALEETVVFGVKCNIPYLRAILSHPEFVDGVMTTQFIATHFPEGIEDPGLTDAERRFAELAWKTAEAGAAPVASDPASLPWASHWRAV